MSGVFFFLNIMIHHSPACSRKTYRIAIQQPVVLRAANNRFFGPSDPDRMVWAGCAFPLSQSNHPQAPRAHAAPPVHSCQPGCGPYLSLTRSTVGACPLHLAQCSHAGMWLQQRMQAVPTAGPTAICEQFVICSEIYEQFVNNLTYILWYLQFIEIICKFFWKNWH
jgi:hypothetical protein